MDREYKLPQVLEKLMYERKLSQYRLAMDLGTGQKQVYQWLNKEVRPSCYFLIELANYFDITLDYLVFGEE